MKIIQYVVKRTIPFFLIAMILVAFILNLIDLFLNITKYMEMNAPVQDVLKVMVLYIPKTMWYAAPIAFLFSVTYILSELYSSNEMEAFFASGISLIRFTMPLFVFSVFCSFLMFFWEDKVVVKTLKQKTELQSKLLGTSASENNNNVVVQSEGGKIIYKVERYIHDEKKIEDCTFIFRDDDKNLLSIITCFTGVWDENNKRWNLYSPVEYVLKGDTLSCIETEDKYLNQLTENYEIFKRANISVESENLKDSKIYIEHLKKAGLPYYEPYSVYLKKFAFPFIMLISGLLAVGVTGRTRKNVLLVSLVLSVATVVLFYVFQMVTMVLAKTQVLTPFMGAWLADIVFCIIAVFLIKNQRT